MATDIVLDETAVVIDGLTLKVNGAELVLDHAPRRAGATAGARRALVHGEGDVLRLNFKGDYRGGVQVQGKLLVDVPALELGTSSARDELEPLDLGQTLRTLLDRVEALREQAEQLQIRATIRADAPHYTQAGWRWCDPCSNLHFATKGTHGPSRSAAYVLFADRSRYGGQGGWGWCRKCQGLSHGSEALSGYCPAGGQHDRSASPNYLVWATEDNHAGFQPKDFDAQDQWRWCNQCYGLFHESNPGVCPWPFGGVHQLGGSSNYHLQW